MTALARHGVAAHLGLGELPDASQPPYALASPESALLQLRGAASALGVPASLGNGAGGAAGALGGAALAELERKAFGGGCYQGVDVGPAARLVVSEMGDAMFEPAAWTEFRDWAGRVRLRAAALGASSAAAAAAAGDGGASAAAGALQQQQPLEAERPPQQQQQQPPPPPGQAGGAWQMAVLA
jgi:hypothetical protein